MSKTIPQPSLPRTAEYWSRALAAEGTRRSPFRKLLAIARIKAQPFFGSMG
jgi:hypothetical protein